MDKQKHEHRLFSKALFKQSYKANYLMWIIVTFAVCFTLASVMVISGGSGIGEIKDSMQETIVQGVMESNIKKTAMNLQGDVEASSTTRSHIGATIRGAEKLFDLTFVEKFNELNTAANANEFISTSAEDRPAKFAELYVTPSVLSAKNKIDETFPTFPSKDEDGNPITLTPEQEGSNLISKLTNVAVFTTYASVDEGKDPSTEPDTSEYLSVLYPYMQSDIAEWGSSMSAGNGTLEYINSDERSSFIDEREYYAVATGVALEFFSEEAVEQLLVALSDYGITRDRFYEMGFTVSKVRRLAYEAAMEFETKLEYEYSRIDPSLSYEETEAEKDKIFNNLSYEIGGSLLDKMPENISTGLKEIGSLDIYSLLVCSIFYKMAGLLLPIIYVIMVSNNLIAGQVDSGSMAYVLSTSTRRRQVTFTQSLFLVSSLVLMFVCSSITSIICLQFVNVNTDLTIGKLLLSNFNSFMIMFAIAGINYFTSCIYDRSRRAMAIGGGISMFFLVATMLGLFGSPVIPSVIRIDALNYFNYVSIMSLFDVISVIEGGFAWIWKCAILLVIGAVGFIVGSFRFEKKDLPL